MPFTPEQEERIREITREEAKKIFGRLARVSLSEVAHRLVQTEKTVERGVRAIQTLTSELLRND